MGHCHILDYFLYIGYRYMIYIHIHIYIKHQMKLPIAVSLSVLFNTIQYAVFRKSSRTIYVSLYIYIYTYGEKNIVLVLVPRVDSDK